MHPLLRRKHALAQIHQRRDYIKNLIEALKAIARQRGAALTAETHAVPDPKGLRRRSRADAKPTPEELNNPHRTIRNLKMLLAGCERDRHSLIATVDYLHIELTSTGSTVPLDLTTTSGRAMRSAVRRMLRRVVETKKALKLGGSKGGEQKAKNEAAKITQRNTAIIKYARSCHQNYSLNEFLDLRKPKWSIGRKQLREIVSSVYPKKKHRVQS